MERNSLYLIIFVLLVCTLKLVHIGYKRIHFSPDLLLNSFKKNFGDQLAVSENVLDANKLILRQKILDFNLSKNLKANAYFRQRMIEFSYPIRLNKNSKFLITQNNEKVNCKLKSQSNKFKLYEC